MPAGSEKEETREAVAIKVPVKGDLNPSKEDEEMKEPEKNKPPKDEPIKDDLSEEDAELKANLELAVERVYDTIEGVALLALETLRTEIRTATSSMTSVPKPLKFLRPHYVKLVEFQKNCKVPAVKKRLADVLSILAMTMAEPNSRTSLKYRIEGSLEDVIEWGHEYLRTLAGEISIEFTERNAQDPPKNCDDLVILIDQIVPYNLSHNAEPEAVDLLLEVSQLSKLLTSKDVDENNFNRVCLYLLRCANYMGDSEDLLSLFNCSFELYKKFKQPVDALRVALCMNNDEKIKNLFNEEKNENVRKQMAYVLGSQRHFSTLLDGCDDADDLNSKIGNSSISQFFLRLATDLDVLESKTPEDIYKSHLTETGRVTRNPTQEGSSVESAKQNAAAVYVNAFVNCAFGKDKLISVSNADGRNDWVFKNKDLGQMSAAASLGMVHQWNIDDGFLALDPFISSTNVHIKAGGVLGIGICNAGVYQPDLDPALGLLSDYLDPSSSKLSTKDFNLVRNSAIMAFGLAYAGSSRDDIWDFMTPLISDTSSTASMETVTLAALSSSMLYVGTCNEDASATIVDRLMTASPAELDQSIARLLALSLGIIYLGKQDEADGMLEVLKTIEHPLGKYAYTTLEGCAYGGTGNVLTIQKMLHECAEHIEDEKLALHQMAAVIGIALIAMGEETGTLMVMRTFGHLLQYGELPIRRAVPLAIAMLYVSNPDYAVIDQLSRLSHDADVQASQAAILSLGIIGAGTNNSRIAGLLRQLSSFYNKEANHLFVVRLAQGLLHMGKGLLTLNPLHSDRLLLNKVALSAILVIIHAATDVENTLADKYHYFMYWLCSAIMPRMLTTVDEKGEPLAVQVKVGQAVETVGQAGRPKTITGFQKHNTPVLLASTERAELAVDDYQPLTSVLEGVVILVKKENPDEKKVKSE